MALDPLVITPLHSVAAMWEDSIATFQMELPDVSTRHRAWIFTINNYSSNDWNHITSLTPRYIIAGKEIGDNLTPHIQGYIYFENKKSSKQVKAYLRPSLEFWRKPASGTPEENRAYCSKQNDFFEFGTLPKSKKQQGEDEKERWQSALDAAKRRDLESIPADILMRNWTNIQRIGTFFMSPPSPLERLQNFWFWGPTGSGKTTTARSAFPNHHLKPINKWFDGYRNQDWILLDEWSPDHKMLATHLKTWADHWPFAAEIKGSTITIRPKGIVVTSNYSLSDCFDKDEDLLPLQRRFIVKQFPLLLPFSLDGPH